MDGEQALDELRHQARSRTQAQLASEIGVSEATVSRWLGAKTPPLRGLERLVGWATRSSAAYAQSSLGPTGPVGPMRVAEAVSRDYQLGVIAGQARAVRQFLTAALDHQESVIRSLDRLQRPAGDPREILPTATLEALEAATARQIAIDEASRREEASKAG